MLLTFRPPYYLHLTFFYVHSLTLPSNALGDLQIFDLRFHIAQGDGYAGKANEERNRAIEPFAVRTQ